MDRPESMTMGFDAPPFVPESAVLNVAIPVVEEAPEDVSPGAVPPAQLAPLAQVASVGVVAHVALCPWALGMISKPEAILTTAIEKTLIAFLGCLAVAC